MRAYIIRLLKKLILLLSLKYDPVKIEVKKLVIQADKMIDVSGEYKRHKVLAVLIKRYPEYRKKDLAFMIEEALQEM